MSSSEAPAHRSAQDFAGDLSDKQLHCRELGHTWKPLTVFWDVDARAYDRRLRCSMCRTIRVQLLTETGHVHSNRYIYPDGYLATNVEAASMRRDVFRLEAVTRFLSSPSALRSVS